ncbi:MAG: hypothetical protein SFT90_07165 [Rickettsiales bacterium]|nr:hypothetical protein [Rickettsiales bacterium]
MKQFYKLIICTIISGILFPTFLLAQDTKLESKTTDKPSEAINKNVKTEILYFENFVRIIFSGLEYSELNPQMQGQNVFIDFTKQADVSIIGYNQVNNFIKSYGFANDNKSVAFRLKNDASKLRKFLADGGVGFDIFIDKGNTDSVISKTAILMSKLPSEKGDKKEDAKISKKEKKEIIISEPLITTYPADLYGPPSIKQEYRIDDSFVGPLASNYNDKRYFELEKMVVGNFYEVSSSFEENIFLLKVSTSNIDSLGAAAFNLGKYSYLILDSKKPIFKSDIVKNSLAKNLEVSNKNNFTIFRLKLKGKYSEYNNYKVIAYSDKDSWNLEIHKKDNKNIENFVKQFPFKAVNEWGENKIIVTLKNISKPIKIKDPHTDESIKIFTSTANGAGNKQRRDFVDLSIENSAQGLVIKEKSDLISYEKDSESASKLYVTKLPSLILSEEILALGESISEDEKKLTSKKFNIFSEQSIFPFKLALEALEKKKEEPKKVEKLNKKKEKKVSSLEPENVDERNISKDFIDGLINKISLANKNDRTPLQKELADYYFSNAYYPEAKGIYEDILLNDSSFKEIFKIKTSLAATKFLTQKYEDSKQDFTNLFEESANNFSANELKFWQWFSNYKYNKKNRITENLEDIDFLEGFAKFMKQYPDDVRFAMGIDYVEYLNSLNKFDDSKAILDAISYEAIPESFENDIKILNGKYLAKIGKYEEAIKIFEELKDNFDDRKNRAIANFELTKLNLILGKIDYKTAINDLLKVSLMWRDDFFEVDVLEAAGNIYLNQKDYMGTLEIWRSIVQNFPQTAESVYILGKMKEVFIDLFDVGSVYELEPLEVLRIYFRFRELMPVGEVGDRITRKVANYFINTDMIDNAVEILKHQITFRSSGDSKAELILWLSQIYLDDNKFEDAGKILDLANNEELSEDISRELKNRRAYILALNGNLDKAIELVKDDFSTNAENARIEVFRQRENWFGIQDKIEPRLQAYIDSFPDPLTKGQIKDIILLAISYASQNENQKLKNLENNFISRLENENDIKLFSFLTSGLNKLDYRDFERTSELEKIQSFLNEYSYLPSKKWLTVASLLEDKVEKLMSKPFENLSLEDKKNVVTLALAYSYLTKDNSERVILDSKKKLSNLSRVFKDVKVDRDTIQVFKMLDKKADPKELDAVFEGKIKLADIEKFVGYYQNSNKFSQLNIMIRDKFNN